MEREERSGWGGVGWGVESSVRSGGQESAEEFGSYSELVEYFFRLNVFKRSC